MSYNPGHIWLIGNELDNFDHDVADGMSPEDYGNFYAHAAAFLRAGDPTAQLIFCQGTYAQSPFATRPATPTPGSPTPGSSAPYGSYDFGPVYCEDALGFLTTALQGTGYTAADLIDGFAVHQYIYDKISNQATREAEVATWQAKLEHFAGWVNSLTAEDLDGRPLYLTEYGDFNNACANTPVPGTPTPGPSPTPLPAGCGLVEESYAWYGDSNQQGFWAIQFHTTDYFLESCSALNEEDCNAQWLASWWFFVGGDPQDAYIGGMFNDPVDLEQENPNAYHYRDAINCHLNGQSCTPSPTPTPSSTSTPTPTATQSSGGIGG